jgi:EmrB/QacA subfamily drug resistance transporter
MAAKWWTLIAVCVGTFMLMVDVTIVNVALPQIQVSLKSSFSDLQWVVDAYALMLAALLLTTGSLADLFGRRLVFVIGLAVFSVSSLLSGLAADPLWLNLARGAQGLGGAAMYSTSLALLGSAFQGRERGTAFGVWGAVTGIGVAIGPVVGGALTSAISWRWIFLVNVPVGVLAIGISLRRVEESRHRDARRPDPAGVITFSGALGALVYALIKGNSLGWGSTVIVSCLAGTAGLLALFLVVEVLQPKNAMFDLQLFRKPTFTGGNIAAFALSGGLFSLFLFLTLYLQDVLRYSALQTGVRFLVVSGGILLTSGVAGRLTAHVPIRLLIAPGLALVGVGLLLMRGLTVGSHWTHLIPGFILTGAGAGMINPPLASTAIGVVRPDRAGMASGINSTFRQVGIATGIAGLGALFQHTVSTRILTLLSGTPGISSQAAHALAAGVSQGSGPGVVIGAIPVQGRAAAVGALRAGFVSGLNKVFLVGAALVFVGAVLTLLLIRSRDFEIGAARTGQQSPDGRAMQGTAAVAPLAGAGQGADTEGEGAGGARRVH